MDMREVSSYTCISCILVCVCYGSVNLSSSSTALSASGRQPTLITTSAVKMECHHLALSACGVIPNYIVGVRGYTVFRCRCPGYTVLHCRRRETVRFLGIWAKAEGRLPYIVSSTGPWELWRQLPINGSQIKWHWTRVISVQYCNLKRVLTHFILRIHNFLLGKFKIFFLCYFKSICRDHHLNRLIETVQMSGHNIYFRWEMKKIGKIYFEKYILLKGYPVFNGVKSNACVKYEADASKET